MLRYGSGNAKRLKGVMNGPMLNETKLGEQARAGALPNKTLTCNCYCIIIHFFFAVVRSSLFTKVLLSIAILIFPLQKNESAADDTYRRVKKIFLFTISFNLFNKVNFIQLYDCTKKRNPVEFGRDPYGLFLPISSYSRPGSAFGHIKPHPPAS